MANNPEDEAAILDVIVRNRIAMWTADFATYETCFVHADYTTRWNASRLDGVFVRQGWDNIAARVKHLFTNPELVSQANAHAATVENLTLRIDGDMAWATYEQRYPDVEHPLTSIYGHTHEVRVLERHGGEWRIAFWGVMDPSISGRNAAVLYLDPDGTVNWTSPQAKAALEADDDLVIRNGRLRIRDSKTDQKLQAAIAWAAELDVGLFPPRGALPIALEAGEGLPTKVWWVIADNGVIAFSMGVAGLNERRLDAAAAVFGLSPTQKRVAALVADGLGLPEIAAKMEITANTARTHLDRIYEKVGVRTQPALVRVLLSTGAPF